MMQCVFSFMKIHFAFFDVAASSTTEGLKGLVSSEIVKCHIKFKFPGKNVLWVHTVVSYLD
jgi:hypothetical protein